MGMFIVELKVTTEAGSYALACLRADWIQEVLNKNRLVEDAKVEKVYLRKTDTVQLTDRELFDRETYGDRAE